MSGERLQLLRGDCRALMAALPPESVDSVVTDPPYHLTSIVNRFGKPGAAKAKANGPTGVYKRASAGFMGQAWDGGDVAFQPATWAAAFRVLKPGGWLMAYCGTRTYHRMACAVEDAGFEVRDCAAWLYGSGFPKSLDVSKAFDKAAGAERAVLQKIGRSKPGGPSIGATGHRGGDYFATLPVTDAARAWEGWGTALKPAMELAVLARKPLAEGSVAAQVLATGTGALNIDGCRIGEREVRILHRNAAGGIGNDGHKGGQGAVIDGGQGRWPANVTHDASAEVLAAFPCDGEGQSPARFFYTAKADATDRRGSDHPTVNPLDLMRWAVRLVTPPGGTVLDPFAGTGTTLLAAHAEGFRAIGCEMTPEYQADIARAIGFALGRPDEAEAGYCAEVEALLAAERAKAQPDADRLARLEKRLCTGFRGKTRKAAAPAAGAGDLLAGLG